MERNDAATLADGLLVAVDPEARYGLKPVLTEAFEMMEAPEQSLMIREGGELSVYLLCGRNLLVVKVDGEKPYSVDVGRVDLTKATLTRACHAIEAKNSGIWWATTWRLNSNSMAEVLLTGQEGPRVIDKSELFARAVARAAGWPLVSDG
jgi:hypothetical protein